MIEINFTPNFKATLTYPNGKVFKIPSQLLPLNRTIECFMDSNTEELVDETIAAIFNSVHFREGRCYTNAQELTNALLIGGIPKERIKTYVGWMVIWNAYPVHHCFVVIDDKHVLDFTAKQFISEYGKFTGMDIDEVRKELSELTVQAHKMSNTESSTFGKVIHEVVYFASQCSPLTGMEIYDKLKKQYPKHVCFYPVNDRRRTQLQQMIYDKEQSSDK